MPVHRETLIKQHELEEAEAALSDMIEEVRVEVLARDLEAALDRIERVRERADELEATLLRVRR